MLVEHCRRASQFFIRLNGRRPLLQYRRLPNNVIELTHTEVPPDLRRKGFAKQLCREVFKFAKEEHMKILPTCSYCHRYANEWATAEERELVVNDASSYL